MTLRSLALAAILGLLAGHAAVAHANGSSSGSGKCAKVKCVASDACHRAGTCDPATGACSNPIAPDGGSCSDGNACTEKDVCRAGLCVGTSKKNGSSCDDKNSCTEKDVCQAGACGGRPVHNGTSCSDGNACTEKDACQAGACTGKLKKNGSSCDDKNPCTSKDVCTAGACAGAKKRDGTECELDDDDNECVSEDGTCRAGTCKPDKAKTCAAPDQCHVGLCDPKTGGCFSRDAVAGTACNDGDSCTSADQCGNGVCTGTPACDDNNTCTVDSCDATRGCVHTLISCDDNNTCTVDSTCDPTVGCVNTPVDCNDSDACTDDSCDPTSGCVHTPLDCDDNNACSGDGCDPERGCVHFGTCDDRDRCTNDRCDPAIGCIHERISCGDDGDPCTVELKCDRELGCRREPRFCDDDNACTADSCDPTSGACVNTLVSCDDNNACTVDSCDPSTGCAHAPVADGTTCDDGNACTPTDTCEAGVCGPCVPAGNCTAPPCNDEDDLCPGVGCAFDADCPTGETCVVGTAPRFVVNGDGTVTDRHTCLVWEQKTTPVNNVTDPGNAHDPDNQYQWSSSGTAADGAAFTGFLAALNAGTGFAGHTDWRLPTSGGSSAFPSGERPELESILDMTATGCGTGSPCISPTFGPTSPSSYWSFTTRPTPTTAWMVSFGDGTVAGNNKGNSIFVRAVRGDSIDPCGDGLLCGTEQCEPGGQDCDAGSECDATCQCVTITTTTTTTTTLPGCGGAGVRIACTCGNGQPCTSPATFDCTGPTPDCPAHRADCVSFCGALGPGTCGTATCIDCTTNLPCEGSGPG